jgi:hypothetical protein
MDRSRPRVMTFGVFAIYKHNWFDADLRVYRMILNCKITHKCKAGPQRRPQLILRSVVSMSNAIIRVGPIEMDQFRADSMSAWRISLFYYARIRYNFLRANQSDDFTMNLSIKFFHKYFRISVKRFTTIHCKDKKDLSWSDNDKWTR